MKKKTIIIAEAGVNHNGSVETAKKLIDAAAEAGADYVKFQTFKAEKLVSQTAQMAEYQVKNMAGSSSSQYEMLKRLELTEDDHFELQSYCNTKAIKFLSTGFDIESVDLLDRLGVDLFKIPSGEITNYSLIKHIAKMGKPIVMSTGMATLEEIDDAFALLLSEGVPSENITILHCNTEYPTPYEDVNLNAMGTIASKFNVPVGYSDHTLGIEVPIGAVALGAVCIEKHFTLDRNLDGPDHIASLEPLELKLMIQSIRRLEASLSGSGIKEPTLSELKNLIAARKSIHLSCNVKKGMMISEDQLIAKRPGSGMSPMKIPSILGKRFARDINRDEMLLTSDIL